MMRSSRRQFIAVGAALAGGAQRAFAQDGARPITILAPFSAGGSDALVRAIAARMQDSLGQPVVVENRPGASGILAAQAVANTMPADGHALLFGGPAHYVLNALLFKKLPYDQTDLVPVAKVGELTFVLLVNPEKTKAANFKELLAASKQGAGGLSYASTGVGTMPHLLMELLSRQAGLKITPMVYKGVAATVQDLLGGHVQVGVPDLGSVEALLKSGKLRAIAITAPERLARLPDIPALAESVPDFSATAWYGFAARKGTPAQDVARLSKAITDAVAHPEVAQRMQALNIRPTPGSAEAFGKLIASEKERWGEVIRQANITLDK